MFGNLGRSGNPVRFIMGCSGDHRGVNESINVGERKRRGSESEGRTGESMG